MALEHNVDLNADRLDPQISDTRVAAAAGAFRPTFNTSVQRNNQLQPPSSFLIPTPTRTDVVTSNVGLGQRLPWFGTSYSVGVDDDAHQQQQLPEQLQPAAAVGAVAQRVAAAAARFHRSTPPRQQLATSRTNRDIADTRLRESLVHTTADVKTRVLEPGVGARERRRAADGARARRGARRA